MADGPSRPMVMVHRMDSQEAATANRAVAVPFRGRTPDRPNGQAGLAVSAATRKFHHIAGAARSV